MKSRKAKGPIPPPNKRGKKYDRASFLEKLRSLAVGEGREVPAVGTVRATLLKVSASASTVKKQTGYTFQCISGETSVTVWRTA